MEQNFMKIWILRFRWIADMSSDIFSRPIDVSKYICIYGGAQKNLAPAGVTFVIVKNDAVGKVSRYIPTMLNYQTHIDNGSMFNTPPVLPYYMHFADFTLDKS